jgi:hypothetical protein
MEKKQGKHLKSSLLPYPSKFNIRYHEIISVTDVIVKQTTHKSRN